MPAVYQHVIRVCPEDLDWLGHVNNVAYFRWLQDAAVAHSDAQGWPTRRYAELGQAWVARAHAIEYLLSAIDGDALVVQTWVAGLSRVTSARRYRVIRAADRTVLATAETRWAFIDLRTGAPCRIPAELGDAFPVVDDPDAHL